MHELSLDYIQASIAMPEPNPSNENFSIAYPVAWYRRAYIDEDGVRYNFGNNRTSKALIIASGDALQNLREKYNSDENVARYLKLDKAKISRCDIALTKYIADDFISVGDIQEKFKQGKIISSWTELGCKTISSFDKDWEILPETFYIGDMEKRGKKGIFRAYDKGLQMNLEPFLITRLEIEDRGDRADMDVRRLLKGNSLASIFVSRLNIDDDVFQKTINAEPCKISRGDAREKRDADEALDKKWDWLINQVAPALKKAIRDEKKRDIAELRLAEFIHKAGLRDALLDGAEFLASQAIIDYDYDAIQSIKAIRKSKG